MAATNNTTTNPTIIARSRDGRTNRWRVTCPKCRKVFEPETTMSAKQHIICPARTCKAEMKADYNAEPATVTLLAPAEDE